MEIVMLRQDPQFRIRSLGYSDLKNYLCAARAVMLYMHQ